MWSVMSAVIASLVELFFTSRVLVRFNTVILYVKEGERETVPAHIAHCSIGNIQSSVFTLK